MKRFYLFFVLFITAGCGEDADDGYIVYKIKNIFFRIPVEYHYDYYEKYSSWPSSISSEYEVEYIEFSIKYPDGSHYSNYNDQHEKGKKININIVDNNRNSLEEFFENIGVEFSDAKKTAQAPGLLQYSIKWSEGIYTDLFYASVDEGRELFEISCDRNSDPIFKSKCIMTIEWKSDLIVKAIFDRDILSDWEVVRDIVVLSIDEFNYR